VSPAGPGPITPIRSTQLSELANEVGHDTGIVERFVMDFLKLLDQRLAAVNEALADADDEGAITVLRSLETTGAMLGAPELADATAALRRAVRDDPDHLDQRLREFTVQAEALRVRLTALSSALSLPRDQSRGAAQPGSVQSGSA
jgi:HPt (histidine-containing phosphotransfer) domain-containing protein